MANCLYLNKLLSMRVIMFMQAIVIIELMTQTDGLSCQLFDI